MALRQAIQRSVVVYRALLRIYPTEFRQRFGSEMLLAFAQQCDAAVSERGAFGLLQSWLRTLGDVVTSACAEWLRLGAGKLKPTRWALVTLLAAWLVSSFLGYVNLHNDEVQLPLAVLLAASFLLGLVRPRGAWLWAAILALSIPVSSLLSLKIGVYYPCRPGHPYSCEPMTLASSLSTLVLLVPALVSAYGGVFLRHQLD